MRTQLRKALAVVASLLILVMGLAFAQAQSGYAQTQAPSNTETKQASDVGFPGSMSTNESTGRPAVTPDTEVLAKQLATVQARLERLEAEQRKEMQNSEVNPAHLNASQR